MNNHKTGLIGRLPTDGGDGLDAIIAQMEREPLRPRVALVVFDAPRRREDSEKGTTTIFARIRRIEPVSDPKDLTALHEMLIKVSDERIGRDQLPITLASDMEQAFDIEWKEGKYTLAEPEPGADKENAPGPEVPGVAAPDFAEAPTVPGDETT